MTLATAEEIAQLAPGLDPAGHSFEWLEEGSVDPNDLRAGFAGGSACRGWKTAGGD